VKYMIMVYASQLDYDGMAGKAGDRPAWTGAEVAAMAQFMEGFSKELTESGELIDTQGLAAPVHTRRIHSPNGTPVVTDGPYAESQEVLAGYWIVDCASFDRATEIAARLADVPGPDHARARGKADIRPIVDSRAELDSQ
jgi:hypothetical protein